jgi:hypothetical protein
MAFPTIEFNDVHPFHIKGGVATDVHLSVATNTIGKSRLSILLTAPSCFFRDGGQEIIQEIETSAADELTEVIITLSIQSTVTRVLFIRLIAEIVNADEESDKSRLIVKLDNRDAPPIEIEPSPAAVPEVLSDNTPETNEDSDSEILTDNTPETETDSDDEPIVDADTLDSEANSDSDSADNPIPNMGTNPDSNPITNPL